MTRRVSNVRVSIVVPHLGDDAAFEDSLVSVLENRPSHCEVVVAHNGHYQDPFELGDEVRFVTAEGESLPELVITAAETIRGRFVHILGPGVLATDGWVEAALEKFEHDDAAIVAPVARHSPDGPITAAGWTSSAARLSAPLAAGKKSLGHRDAATVRGACLTASFWRSDELRSAIAALPTDSLSAAQFGWPRLLCRQGWRCLLAEDSLVIANEATLGLSPSRLGGVTLRSLEAEIEGTSFAGSAMSVGIAAMSNLLRPRVWGEVTGEVMSLVLRSPAVRSLRLDTIHSPDEVIQTIRMPQATGPSVSIRRAA